jgi:hypothetical protein
MVKKLRLFNLRHKTSIIMKNTCEEPKLLNPRHKTLVIMKDKFKLLNHGHKNILITKGVLTPSYGSMVMDTMASGNGLFAIDKWALFSMGLDFLETRSGLGLKTRMEIKLHMDEKV